jgi:hypothetical protein
MAFDYSIDVQSIEKALLLVLYTNTSLKKEHFPEIFGLEKRRTYLDARTGLFNDMFFYSCLDYRNRALLIGWYNKEMGRFRRMSEGEARERKVGSAGE